MGASAEGSRPRVEGGRRQPAISDAQAELISTYIKC